MVPLQPSFTDVVAAPNMDVVTGPKMLVVTGGSEEREHVTSVFYVI